MMSYVKTTQDIYNWYMHNPNADASLIQSFRTVMNSGGSGQTPNNAQSNNLQNQPSLNTTRLSSSSDDYSSSTQLNPDTASNYESSAHNDTDEPSSGYDSPLGVFEDNTNSSNYEIHSGPSSALGLAAMGIAVAGAGVGMYEFTKSDKST